MQKIAESNGFEIVGGDTDSLILLDVKGGDNEANPALSELITESKEKIGIDLEVSTSFVKAIITKKKHYFGVTSSGDIIVKGMEGVTGAVFEVEKDEVDAGWPYFQWQFGVKKLSWFQVIKPLSHKNKVVTGFMTSHLDSFLLILQSGAVSHLHKFLLQLVFYESKYRLYRLCFSSYTI